MQHIHSNQGALTIHQNMSAQTYSRMTGIYHQGKDSRSYIPSMTFLWPCWKIQGCKGWKKGFQHGTLPFWTTLIWATDSDLAKGVLRPISSSMDVGPPIQVGASA